VGLGILEVLKEIAIENRELLTYVKVEALWLEKTGDSFENYMKNTNFEVLKNNGLLFI
jgi:hypothetical protein